MSDPITQLQQDIYGRLFDDADFSTIQVLLFRPRDQNEAVEIINKLNQGLAGLITTNGKAGAAVMVMLPSAEVSLPDVPGPRMDMVYRVRVYEQPLVNMGSDGTQITAERLALNVQSVLHQFYVGNLGGTLISDPHAIVPVENAEEGRIIYDCALRIPLGLQKPSRVAIPGISGTTSAVTITCATSGATIKYTTDGSYPGTTSATSSVYSVPFAVSSGDVVRAVATKTGMQASVLAAKTIT